MHLRVHQVEIGRVRARVRGQRALEQVLGAAVVASRGVEQRQVVERLTMIGIDVEQLLVGLDRAVGVARRVVAAERHVPLALGEAIALGERLGDGLVGAIELSPLVAERHAELAVRHREVGVGGDRLLEQRDAAIDVALHLERLDGLRVLAKGGKRARAHAVERRRGVHAPQRLADLFTQALGEVVDRRNEIVGRAGALAEGRELLAVGAHQPGRDQELRADARELALDDGLDALALRQLARDRRVEVGRDRALHAEERVAHLGRLHDRDHARLPEIRAERLADHRPQQGVAGARELGDENGSAPRELVGRHQRRTRADPHRAQHEMARDDEREGGEHRGAAPGGALPREPAVHRAALARPRRDGGMMRIRHHGDHRETERHQHERGRKHPRGEAHDRRQHLGRELDDDDCRGVGEQRARKHGARRSDGRRERAGARRHGALELLDHVVGALRAIAGTLGEAAHDDRLERRRNIGAQLGEGARRLREMSGERRLRRAPAERGAPDEQLVPQDA